MAWYLTEKDKIKDMTARQKADYIARYYWLWILGIASAVVIIGYVIYRANFALKDYWFYGMCANTMEDGGNGSDLWKDFVAYAGYDTSVKKVEMNARSYFDPSKSGGTNNSYFEAFVALVESGDLDVLVMGEEGLKGIGASGRLKDLSDETCRDLVKQYEDRFVYCIPYDEEYSDDPVPVGIDISDSLLVTRYHLYEKDCVLGIGAYTTRMDSALTFLRFVLEEDQAAASLCSPAFTGGAG